jgi:hypothetical protein
MGWNKNPQRRSIRDAEKKGSDVGMKQERIRTDIGEQNGIVMCEPFQGDSKLLSCACSKKSFGNFLLSVISRPVGCRARCISLVVWCFSNFPSASAAQSLPDCSSLTGLTEGKRVFPGAHQIRLLLLSKGMSGQRDS